MNVVLNPGELLFLSMLTGAKEVFGIPDIYFGKTDEEIRYMVEPAATSCREKEWYSVSFDGDKKLSSEMEQVINRVSFADSVTEIVLRTTNAKQVRYLLYTKNRDTVVLQENESSNKLCVISDMFSLKTGLYVLFSQGCLVKGETEKFTVSRVELEEIRTAGKNKSGAFRALLREKNVDSVTTQLIAEATLGRAGYFSAATIQIFPTQRYTSIFYVADSGLVFQVKRTPEGDLGFERVSCDVAKQTAAAFIGGDFYV